MCSSESSAIGSGFFFSSICGRLVGGPFTLVTFPLAAILGGEGSVLAFLLWGWDLGVSAAFFLRVVGLVAGCWGDPSTSITSSDSVGTPYFVSILDMLRPCFFFFMAIALVNISCTYRLSLSVMAGLLRTAWQDAMRPSTVSPGSNSNSSTSDIFKRNNR